MHKNEYFIFWNSAIEKVLSKSDKNLLIRDATPDKIKNN